MVSEPSNTTEVIMANTTLTVNHDSSENIVISKQQKSKWLFPFIPIGNSSMRNPECIDALDVICSFNKQELLLLSIIKNQITPEHKVIIVKGQFDSSDNRKITSAINSWIKRGILKRERKEHYMVSPYFLVPSKAIEQPTIKQEWDSL